MEQLDKKTTNTIRYIALIVIFSLLSYDVAYSQSTATPHFNTVWQGENGQNHMNFVIISALLEDLPLGSADEIAVFCGSYCVGATILTQTINPSVSSSFASLIASESDGSNNGFIANDTIIFKIWDSKNQKEMLAKAVKYRNDVSLWLTSGRYAVGATTVVEIVSYTEYTQTIPILKGTNLFSSFLVPSKPNFGIILKPICDQGALIKVLDEAGNSFEYLNGGWINKIGSLTKTEGYSISLNSNSQLQITGRAIALPLEISLKKGWNYISYPRMDLVDAMSIVQPIINLNKLLKVQDEKGNTIEKIKGTWKNSIGNFAPGKAYKISVSGDVTLTIQKIYTKSVVSIAQPENTEYFISERIGNGSGHMNINMTGLAESGFSIGDELAAFDGNICVGSLKLTSVHLSNDLASLIASSTDEVNRIGFTSGKPIQIYRWNSNTGDKSTVPTQILDGEMNYQEFASVLLKSNLLTTSAKKISNSVDIEIFPNPATVNFTIKFSQMPENGSTIEITDIAGRRIASRVIHSTTEEFNIGKQSPGMYLVKSRLGSENLIQKLSIK